jgi:hypothetical protein
MNCITQDFMNSKLNDVKISKYYENKSNKCSQKCSILCGRIFSVSVVDKS